MFKKALQSLALSILLITSPVHAFNQKVIKANGLEFWTESFGNPQDPAVLLIMGHARPGLMWHQAFCEQLASKGFFVIRYDHRDTGLSSAINYKKHPYNHRDMAEDALGILDGYGIGKAHLVGYSMGCPISLIAAADHPTRIASLTLMSGSIDFRPCIDALSGKKHTHVLSACSQAYVDWVHSFTNNPPKSQTALVDRLVQGERILSGTGAPFDEPLLQELALQNVIRAKSPDGNNNHRLATEASHQLHQSAATKTQAPTVIIQGTLDIIFDQDHGENLKQKIANSKLVILEKMGHALNAQFYNEIIDQIIEVADQAKS